MLLLAHSLKPSVSKKVFNPFGDERENLNITAKNSY
jgi:hypothetical protein